MEAADPGTVSRAIPTVEILPVQFEGRQVGRLTVDVPGERDEWEMHPHQDEFLYLLEGAIDVFLREDLEMEEERTVHLHRGEACVVPKGMWHRQVAVAPCRMLFLTPETLHKPHSPERGWSESSDS